MREEGIPDINPSPQPCSLRSKGQRAAPRPQSSNLAYVCQMRASKGLSSALGETSSWPRLILLALRLSVTPNHCYKVWFCGTPCKIFSYCSSHISCLDNLIMSVEQTAEVFAAPKGCLTPGVAVEGEGIGCG